MIVYQVKCHFFIYCAPKWSKPHSFKHSFKSYLNNMKCLDLISFMTNNSVELNRIKQKKRKIFHIVFHFLFLSFQAYTIKRSTGVQSSVNRSMPDIGAVSPKIDRRGIKIVHPGKVDLMDLGHI